VRLPAWKRTCDAPFTERCRSMRPVDRPDNGGT
jgi:hypothetical protein